jgi:predicted Zn-dependent protease
MMRQNRYDSIVLICVLYVLFAFGVLSGCKTMEAITDVGASIGQAAGAIDSSQANSIRKSGRAVARSFEDFTPEQEYYIGRTVGAMIMKQYRPYTDKTALIYINTLGQTLARFSDLPETFGGYHFLILDSDEINAFAAPGGLIFVTRGMLRCCRNEDAVAAVLAHEIGHVQEKHGLQAIKKSRITSALTIIGMESAKQLGGQELSDLTRIFEKSISDVTATLVNNGYSRSFEREADRSAITILQRVGYNPLALVDMLEVMEKRLEPGGPDFARTHPPPKSRISDIRNMADITRQLQTPRTRQARFQAALGDI